ncbi:MAG: glycosyltransferase family 2 protein [Puia sp.]|nr:glycosyltransferase family 2 protein [Puia sp.]
MFLLIIHIFFLLLGIYLFFSVGYLLVAALAGRWRKKTSYGSHPEKKKMLVLIPSYREDHIILDTASRAIRQNYPASRFDVFVIADKLQASTIEKLREIPVGVVEVQFETSMKSRSVNAALNQLSGKGYDIVMILDADNIMESNTLEKVNAAFQKGFQAVQCHRTAKNKNNAVAVLDAISEEINNNLFRSGQRALGFSAALIGSGMAFEFEKIRSIFNLDHILNNPGEDREIDLQLMKDGIVVEYIEDAWVYDEKVSSSEVFQKQRTRWLEAQLSHFSRFLDKDIRSASGTSSFRNKFFQTLLLPRSLLLLLFGFLMITVVLTVISGYPLLFPAWGWWIGLFGAFLLSLLISVPASFYNADTVKAVVHIPVLVFAMVRAMLKMKANRKEFLHTPKAFK